MLKIIAELAASIYLTSTLLMLYFYINAVIVTYRNEKKLLIMPLKTFLYFHFCPIVHTKKCISILIRTAILKEMMKKREV